MHFNTKVIHAGVAPDASTGAVATPLYLSTTFAFEDIGKNKGYDYSRSGNPTRKVLEDNLAALEGGKFCSVVPTGMGAETVVFSLFSKGDHVVCGNDVYGGTVRLLNAIKNSFGFEVTYVPMTDPEVVKNAIKPNTKLIWMETPSNPLLNIVDLEKVNAIAKEHNIITVVDNTFLSPYFQKPLEFGIDIIVHSTTKYLSGHNDGLGGAIICSDEELFERIAFNANAYGIVGGAFDSYLLLRGIKTLAIRMREHETSALQIAEFLENHKRIKKVYYPGLKNHPQYDLAKKQMSGFGGMLSFEVEGGIEVANNVLRNTQYFYLAESFGSVESLIQHPQTMSHASMTPEEQIKGGITESLVRISVGLEDIRDLIEDLDKALA